MRHRRSRWTWAAWALGVALFVGACSSGAGAPKVSKPSHTQPTSKVRVTGPPTPIDGTYYSGVSLLTFEGGVWTRNLPAMNGAFTVSGDRLTLSDQDGCPGEGTYTWSLQGEVLLLVKVSDSCAQRDVQFLSTEKWGLVHRWGEQLEDGQGLLLADGQHVANYHGQLDVTGQSQVSLEATLTLTSGLIFSPTVLIGSPGQTVTLTITNPKLPDAEPVPHNFRIDQLGISAELAFGGSATVTVTFPQSGGLRFYCGYHARFNQQGELLVGA